jgi:uncharacterized protein YceH (UPF0502 family)
MLNLNPVEARVLGALIEKEITTPEYYPLSLNALVNACNQKNNREPVMALGEADVRSALFELENLSLVRVLNDSRATKFEHLTYNVLNLRRPEIAVMGLLLLRGPQTPAELRTRAERMYSFEDTAAATETLERLAAREESLVVQMVRQPGSREARWMHLLSGAVDTTAGNAAVPRAGNAGNDAAAGEALERIAQLEALVQAMDERVKALESALGIVPAAPQ